MLKLIIVFFDIYQAAHLIGLKMEDYNVYLR